MRPSRRRSGSRGPLRVATRSRTSPTTSTAGATSCSAGPSSAAGTAARPCPWSRASPRRVVDDAFVLEYGTDRALSMIRDGMRRARPRARGAGAVPEPRPPAGRVPARSSGASPTPHGFVLVFDEIVTGFRAHQRRRAGAVRRQGGHHDVRQGPRWRPADRAWSRAAAEFIDVIDGGSWSFGDDSFPRRTSPLPAGR